jgi:hypothetical protein
LNVIRLASETEAHSDDEQAALPAQASDTGEIIYHIKEKEGRSDKVKNFFRLADDVRRRMAKGKRKHAK